MPKKRKQELQMLSSVTLNCQVTKIPSEKLILPNFSIPRVSTTIGFETHSQAGLARGSPIGGSLLDLKFN